MTRLNNKCFELDEVNVKTISKDFWISLQGVWGEIDRVDPNPMKCPEDIKTYAKLRSEQKLFQFLNGLDRTFETIKRELLRVDPLPTVEAAYSTIRKEAAHQAILGATTTDNHGVAAGLQVGSSEPEGLGLAGKGYRGKKPFVKEDKSHLKCGECKMIGHTRNQCFKIVGYPDWWNDGHKKGSRNPRWEKAHDGSPTSRATTSNSSAAGNGFGGVAAAATAAGEGDGCSSFMAAENKPWIFDCGATDTMTYDVSDFIEVSKPVKTHIETANGEKMGVKNGGTIKINLEIKLPNCLYVPSLSHKLLSISHVTKELNCSVLMHPSFYLLQDIKTGRIIGRGTEKRGLYYVDEVTQSGTVMLAHGTTERKAWLWHRRLGHPS
nr:hypothetical protein [Tanacetum cinerariifolium]